MEREKIVVTEQAPTSGGSIFCRVEIKLGERCTVHYVGMMYFICDTNKNITQYFPWMKVKKARRQLLKLGYKL